MSNGLLREALRGEEEAIFDFVSDALLVDCNARAWAEWLKTALERAVAHGDQAMSRKVVGAGAECETALHDAVDGGRKDMVIILVESGARANSPKEPGGFTPLHLAAGHGDLDMTRLLLLNGADANAQISQGSTPLHVAVQYGYVEVVKALLAGGGDIAFRFEEVEMSSVRLAAHLGHVTIVRALIKHGADLNALDAFRGPSALHWAAASNEVEAIDVLVEVGATASIQDADGTSSFGCGPVQSRVRVRTPEAWCRCESPDLCRRSAATFRSTKLRPRGRCRGGRPPLEA